MKKTSINSINTAGLVGYVISILLIIAIISLMVFTAIATAGAITVSKDNISVKVATDVDINSTGNFLSKLNHFIGISGVKDLNDLVTDEDTSVKVNDRDISQIKVEENGNGLKINAKMSEINFSIKRVIAALVCTFVFLACALVSVEMLKFLMKTLRKCETPFSEDVVKKMLRFANSLIPAVVTYSLTDSVWSSFSSGSDYTINLSVVGILLVAVVYLLVYVFKYGAELQRESDETL